MARIIGQLISGYAVKLAAIGAALYVAASVYSYVSAVFGAGSVIVTALGK